MPTEQVFRNRNGRFAHRSSEELLMPGGATPQGQKLCVSLQPRTAYLSGETARSVECSLCKHEDPSSTPGPTF